MVNDAKTDCACFREQTSLFTQGVRPAKDLALEAQRGLNDLAKAFIDAVGSSDYVESGYILESLLKKFGGVEDLEDSLQLLNRSEGVLNGSRVGKCDCPLAAVSVAIFLSHVESGIDDVVIRLGDLAGLE